MLDLLLNLRQKSFFIDDSELIEAIFIFIELVPQTCLPEFVFERGLLREHVFEPNLVVVFYKMTQ